MIEDLKTDIGHADFIKIRVNEGHSDIDGIPVFHNAVPLAPGVAGGPGYQGKNMIESHHNTLNYSFKRRQGQPGTNIPKKLSFYPLTF